MNHEQARDNLPLFADGELDPERTAELEVLLSASAELRAELERWQALRRCANRVVMAAAIPGGLEDRIRAGLGRSRRFWQSRPLRLFASTSGLAAAAVLMLALWLWPTATVPSGVRLIAADSFADRYRHCACEHRCRDVDVDLGDIAAARERLAGLKSFPVLLPDLRDRGFELDGVCLCFKVPGVSVVHAFYRRSGPEPAVVSFFSLDQKVHLKDCRCESCTGPDGLLRHYEIAECQSVLVCKWDEAVNSFAVCGEMQPGELRELADSVKVAFSRDSPSLVLARAVP